MGPLCAGFKEGKSMTKGVFFDFYNTLVTYDPPREEMEARALQELGVKASPEALRLPLVVADDFLYREHARVPLSKRSPEETRVLYTRYQEVLLREAKIPAPPELIGNLLAKWKQWKFKMVLFDDAMPALLRLKAAGLTLGLISNVDHDIMPVCRELGLADVLQVIVTSLDTGFNKPQPEIFQVALDRTGVKPDESIYIGDQHRIDVAGANSAGMRGILLDRYGYMEKRVKSPCIRSLAEIDSLL
jgi:putative hydrolase of the HAD superfamily